MVYINSVTVEKPDGSCVCVHGANVRVEVRDGCLTINSKEEPAIYSFQPGEWVNSQTLPLAAFAPEDSGPGAPEEASMDTTKYRITICDSDGYALSHKTVIGAEARDRCLKHCEMAIAHGQALGFVSDDDRSVVLPPSRAVQCTVWAERIAESAIDSACPTLDQLIVDLEKTGEDWRLESGRACVGGLRTCRIGPITANASSVAGAIREALTLWVRQQVDEATEHIRQAQMKEVAVADLERYTAKPS